MWKWGGEEDASRGGKTLACMRNHVIKWDEIEIEKAFDALRCFSVGDQTAITVEYSRP
jgi:hypothetical protein